MRITFADAQRNVSEIANRESYSLDVIFELLAAYGRSASAITKLRSGALNLAADKDNEVLQRGVVYFKHVPSGNLLSVVDSLDKDPLVVRYNPRYLIATNYDQLVAKDTKKDTTLDIKLRDIDRNVDFFYGWTGDEVTSEKTEAVADRRAADKMKDLYLEIERINIDRLTNPKSTFRHDLNVFFSRLLFCFFAEDTRIFSKEDRSIFTDSIKDYTQTDGSDLDVFLQTLFNALDTRDEDKHTFTSPFSKFPYVNGTIFDTKKHDIAIPKFNAQARKLILDCGNQNWAEINPDIFGSMFQSIVDEGHRATNGMHYTSVPNIMKTIEPLFLDELREEFDKYYDNPSKLVRLWERISKIKVFDPACGSGNFLIIAYKELRKIEHAIIERLLNGSLLEKGFQNKLESQIKLDNFYGIEIDDFAHEVAILSLYLAKHQMNIEFEQQFGREIKLIPLKDNAKIVHANAARIDWNEVCPNIPQKESINIGPEQGTLIDFDDDQPELDFNGERWDEIYLIGNPPYQGRGRQSTDQKNDMKHVMSAFELYKGLDYISIWFKKGVDYISGTDAKLAFVSTNSITQGEQVAMLWPRLLERGISIIFAHTSFKWANLAKSNAGVTVVVIGLAGTNTKRKKVIITKNEIVQVDTINPYLAPTNNIFVQKSNKSISMLPHMSYGNMPMDGGNLIMDDQEKESLLRSYPASHKFIKRFYGAREYINDITRWCIWIEDTDLEEALCIPPLSERIAKVREFRLASSDEGTRKQARRAHQFRDVKKTQTTSLIFPQTTSENREYIPIGFLGSDAIISNAARVIYESPLWLFGILTSKMHNVWLRAVSGRLKTDMQYSNTLSYNTFPLRHLSPTEQSEIRQKARNILLIRENHSEKTLAEKYDPNKMPEDLRQAHHELDLAVDKLYRSKPYNSDEERLADLFALYEQMTAAEKEKTR